MYAASAATPDGKLLIIGGVGDGGAILDTVEMISLEEGLVMLDTPPGAYQRQHWWKTDTLTGRHGIIK